MTKKALFLIKLVLMKMKLLLKNSLLLLKSIEISFFYALVRRLLKVNKDKLNKINMNKKKYTFIM